MRKSSEGHFKVFIVWLLKMNTTKEDFLKKPMKQTSRYCL